MSCGLVTLDWRETIDLVWRGPRPRMGRKASGRQTKTHITWHGMLYLKAAGRVTTAEQGVIGLPELCRPQSGTRSSRWTSAQGVRRLLSRAARDDFSPVGSFSFEPNTPYPRPLRQGHRHSAQAKDHA